MRVRSDAQLHMTQLHSAELKGPRKRLKIEPELGRKRSQIKPKTPGTVPTDRRMTIPIDYGLISACVDDDPKLVNCEMAQPSVLKIKIKIKSKLPPPHPGSGPKLRKTTIRTLGTFRRGWGTRTNTAGMKSFTKPRAQQMVVR
jgi:hypothetical protein